MLARLLGLRDLELDPLRRAALTVAVVWAAWWAWASLTDAAVFSGVDLRDKVVAGRAWLLGLDPYRFAWTADMPHADELLDASRRVPGPSRSTYVPTVIALYSLTSPLPYGAQRMTWWALEWAALLASVVTLVRLQGRRLGRVDFLIVSLAAFAGAYVWRLHAERGQYYVFLVLLEALGLWALARRDDSAWHGLAWGTVMALRPTTAALLPFLALAKRWRTAGGAAAWAFALVALTLALGMGPYWPSFLDNARELEAWVHDPYYFLNTYGPRVEIPAEAEGMVLNRELYLGTWNTTTVALFSGFGASLEVTRLASRALAASWIAGWLFVAWRAPSDAPPTARLAAGLLAVLGAGFCVPIRWGYVDVLWLPFLAAVWPTVTRLGRHPMTWLLLVALVLGIGHPLPQPLMVLFHAARELLLLSVGGWLVVTALRAGDALGDDALGELGVNVGG